jgi:type IV pilus assembly protein PilM
MSQSRSIFHRLFSDILPPPRFLEMPAVGLDISDEAVRFVALERKGSSFKVAAFGTEQLPKDVIEEGYVKNKDALVKALKAIKDKHGLRFVISSLPEEKAYLFKTQIPNMNVADIRGALRFKLEENVPVPLADAVFDYRFIKEPKPKDTHIDLAVAVIHIKVVESYLDVLNAAGLTPLEMRIESQAIAHAVIPKGDEDTHIILAVKETKTILTIVSKGVIQYSSTLTIGGQSLAASIKKNFAVDDDVAAKIRQGKEVRESNEMFQSLVNATSVVRDEIQKLFAYWDSREEVHGPIKSVIICGSDALLGFDDYLTRSLQVPVKIANVWTNILSVDTYIPQISYRESLDYASALGLALPYE